MYKYLVMLSLFVLINCSEKSDPISFFDEELMDFRDIAWNDLSEAEILTITTSKEEFIIKYSRKLSKEDDVRYFKVDNQKYSYVITNPAVDIRNDQIIVIVVINTSDEALLGPIFVMIEPNSKVVFGRGTRE